MYALLLFSFLDDINILIIKLGDESFEVRQTTQKELEDKMDFNLYKRLKNFNGDVLEIHIRVQRATTAYEKRLIKGFKPDLKGYPAHPFIDSLPWNYTWEELSKNEITQIYRTLANGLGVESDNSPKWSDYREATRLWISDRIHISFEKLLKNSRDEKEFIKGMGKVIEEINIDIVVMIEADEALFKKIKIPNPLRSGKSK